MKIYIFSIHREPLLYLRICIQCHRHRRRRCLEIENNNKEEKKYAKNWNWNSPHLCSEDNCEHGFSRSGDFICTRSSLFACVFESIAERFIETNISFSNKHSVSRARTLQKIHNKRVARESGKNDWNGNNVSWILHLTDDQKHEEKQIKPRKNGK